MSPIDRLPPEILADIFLLVPSRGVELPSRSPYPWRLALVCKRWKDVAFVAPQLWSNITVLLDPVRATKIDTHGDALVAAWKLCLLRSGIYPLIVTLSASSSEAMAFVPTLLESLVDHAEHWDNITFDFPIDILLKFMSNSDTRYPRLRRVHLRGREDTPTDEHPPSVRLFQSAPLLSQLSFHEFYYSPLTLKIPWSQITKLTVYMNPGLGVYRLLDGLRYMPNLSSLGFWQFVDMSPPFISTEQPNQLVRLPHLRKLSWQTFMSNGNPFFDLVCAPQLSEMEFNCMDEYWDQDIIRRFLRRSMCPIKSLRLHMTSPNVTPSFLTLLPDVESLTLSSVPMNIEVIRSLTFEDAESFLVPKLKSMVLFDAFLQGECQGAFVDMIRSRLRVPPNVEGSGHKLESLQIKTSLYPGKSSPKLDPYSILQGGLSPEEMMLVTNQTASLEELS